MDILDHNKSNRAMCKLALLRLYRFINKRLSTISYGNVQLYQKRKTFYVPSLVMKKDVEHMNDSSKEKRLKRTGRYNLWGSLKKGCTMIVSFCEITSTIFSENFCLVLRIERVESPRHNHWSA